jgi:hypothetical protein
MYYNVRVTDETMVFDKSYEDINFSLMPRLAIGNITFIDNMIVTLFQIFK